MTRTVLRSVLVTSAVAALVAGCGTPEAGAAATLDGRRISVQDVQQATVDIQKVSDGAVPQGAVVYLLAAAPYIQQLAVDKYKSGVSDDDVRSVFGSKVPHPSKAALTVIRANVALNTIRQSDTQNADAIVLQINDDLARAKFTVNPRYGAFDPKQPGVQPVQPNWLPTPPPTAAAQ